MNKNILIVFSFVIISLIPSIALFIIFGQMNKADVQWKNEQMVQLGGPIASFFLTLIMTWNMYKYIKKNQKKHDKFTDLLQGDWNIISVSDINSRSASSSTHMDFEDSFLVMTGGVFTDISTESCIGHWNVEIAMTNGRTIKFFYNLTDNLSPNQFWKGVAELYYIEDSNPIVFDGTWQVLGRKLHHGRISMKKAID